MKRVLVFAPPGYPHEAAFRIRILALIDAMARRGYGWHIAVRPKGPWGRIRLARSARDFHAVILHRRWLDPYEARALRRNVRPPHRIFMDIDDATMLHETALGSIARRRLDRRFAATRAILDRVCAGNAYLAETFFQRPTPLKTRIIPSVVAPERCPVKTHTLTASPRLVWIGSSSTLKYLEQILPALGEAARQIPGLILSVICDRPPATPADLPTNPALPIEFHPWSQATEATQLAQADIGIAPTPENPWTLGKCGFKIVQYMAAGLPVIASPVGMNITLVNGNSAATRCGLLANSPADWLNALTQLAHDAALRQQLGAAGRTRVEHELCIEHVADIWADVLSEA